MFFYLYQNSLIYCHFRLKLRAVRLLRKHFIAKNGVFSNSKVDAFFIAENYGRFKIDNSNRVADFNVSFFSKTRLLYCDFSLRYKIAFSAIPEFDNSLIAENYGTFKNSN